MDLLRGLAVILVVLMHASKLGTGAAVEGGGWVVNDILRPFRMPLLLVLSGLLLHHSLAKGVRHYIVGKLRGIVWPWLVWMAVMVVVLTEDIPADPVAFFALGTPLWYLAVLGCSYALALITRRVPAVATAATLFVLADITQERNSLIPTYLWYSGFFFAGAALRSVLDRWQAVRAWVPAILAVVAVVGGLGQVARGSVLLFRPDQAVVSLAGVLVAVWVAARLPRTRPVRAIEWIGRDSIVTYLAHYPLLRGVQHLMGKTGWGEVATVWVSFAVVLGCCVLLTYLRPWTGWLYRMPSLSGCWRQARADGASAGGPQRGSGGHSHSVEKTAD